MQRRRVKLCDVDALFIGTQRDALASQIKNDLFNAEFNNTAIPGGSDLSNCTNILSQADALAAA